MTESKEVYLGDGLYASYDGYQIMLRAPRGFDVDHEVYLEPSTLQSFQNYIKELENAKAKALADRQ